MHLLMQVHGEIPGGDFGDFSNEDNIRVYPGLWTAIYP